MATLRSLSVMLSMNATQFKREANKVDRQFRKMSRGFDRQSRQMSNSLQKIGIAMVGVGVASRSLIRTADNMTEMRNSLGAVLPNATAVHNAMVDIQKIALDSRQDLTSVSKLYSRIALSTEHLALGADKTATVVSMFSNSLKLSGSSGAQASSAILQFGQALAGGRVHAEEFNSILENNPKFAIEMAKWLKVNQNVGNGTAASLRTLVKEGGVTAQMMIDFATDAEVAANMQEKVKNMAFQVSDAMTNMRTRFDFLVDSLNTTFRVNEKLAGGLRFLTENMDTIAKRVIPATVLVLGALAAKMALTFTWTMINAAVALPAMISQFVLLKKMQLVEFFQGLATNIASFGKKTLVAAAKVIGIVAGLYAVSVVIRGLWKTSKEFGKNWTVLFSTLGDVVSGIGTIIGSAFKLGFAKVMKGIKELVNYGIEAINKFRDSDNQISLFDLEGSESDISSLESKIAEAQGKVAAGVTKLGELNAQFGSAAWANMKETIMNDMEFIKNLPATALAALGSKLDSLGALMGTDGITSSPEKEDEEGTEGAEGEGPKDKKTGVAKMLENLTSLRDSFTATAADGQSAFQNMAKGMKTYGDVLERGAAKSKKIAALKKALLIKEIILNQKAAIMAAWTSAPFPANLGAVAITAAQTAMLVKDVMGGGGSFSGMGKEIPKGQFHDGIDNVPSTGTYLLEQGERVVDSRLNGDLKEFMANPGQAQTAQPATVNLHVNGVSDPDVVVEALSSRRGELESMMRRIALDSAGQTNF